MKPYYQDSAVTIYHGDCREIMPHLPICDVVLTDPPYLGLAGGLGISKGGVGKHRRISQTIGNPWNASLDWAPLAIGRARMGLLVFCTYHSVSATQEAFSSAKPIALLTWYKRNTPLQLRNVPRFTSEFIWAFSTAPGLNWGAYRTTVFDFANLTAGCVSTGERFTEENGSAAHPSQKPLSLLNELLAIGGETILDPFLGTGTTLRAAKDLQRKAIGVEINEAYCEIAAKRMAQEVLALA